MSVIYTDNINFGENMKKTLILIGILFMGMPTMADIINPNLSEKQIQELRAEKQRMYIERQRNHTIGRVCGSVNSDKELNNCKKKLYDDYIETINFLENKYNKI